MPPTYPPGSYPALVVADGATAYWRLGETSGTTAVDVIGGAHGTISGGVTLGQAGALADGDKAMSFDGTTGTILTAASVALPVSCTLEAWMKTTDTRGNQALLSNRFSVQDGIVVVYMSTLGGFVVDSYQGGNHFAYSSNGWNDGVWHHVVWTSNGSIGRIFIDGVENQNQAQPHVALTARCQIAFDTFNGVYGNGLIDEVAIYPTALTAPQIAAHYAARTWTKPNPFPVGSYPHAVFADGATAYWRLGETSGTTAVDVIGGAHGTISGGVTLGQAGALSDGDTAMAFNGTTGKVVTVANVPLLTPYTLEAWIQTTSPAAQKVILSTLQEPTPQDALMVQVNAHQLRIYIEHSGGATSDLNPTEFFEMADGIWHHLVIAFVGATVAVYFDGVQKTWTNQPSPPLVGSSSHFVELGTDSKYGLFYGGSLDDVAIYPTALTAPQIAAHYAARTWAPFVLGKALTFARAGMARSGATRSNYVSVLTSIDWIIRDSAGTITETRDLSHLILLHSLTITQALHDEPDTCSFSLSPTVPPSAWPPVGAEIRVSWAPGGDAGVVLFHGFALIVQQDWRLGNLQGPWGSVQCQDPMWRFDARIVTYRFPTQSVTASIEFLVTHFCNLSPTISHPFDFQTSFVQADMPSIPAFDVVNQRPSTVLRTLTSAVSGGFYLEGFTLHAWANSVTQPNQPNPQPLTVDLSTLKAFRLTTDATQLRRSVIVEGRRTTTLIALPIMDVSVSPPIGIPLTDASFFPALTVDDPHYVRLGSQWMQLQAPVTMPVENPPQTRLSQAFTPGDISLVCEAITPPPPAQGWIRIGNQYAAYQSSIAGVTLELILAGSVHPYGQLTVPMAIGETVEFVPCVMENYPRPLPLDDLSGYSPIARAQPVDTPVVVFAQAQAALDTWPPLEGFVQDGRYSYAGAQARAEADLAVFRDPLTSMEWDTEDLNALPGRAQAIAMASDTISVSDTVTILRVDLTFPLRTRPPRRRCAGGHLKPSSFLDVVVTSSE